MELDDSGNYLDTKLCILCIDNAYPGPYEEDYPAYECTLCPDEG